MLYSLQFFIDITHAKGVLCPHHATPSKNSSPLNSLAIAVVPWHCMWYSQVPPGSSQRLVKLLSALAQAATSLLDQTQYLRGRSWASRYLGMLPQFLALEVLL